MTRSIRITSGSSSTARSMRLVAVGRLADDLEALLERQERAQPLAHDRVIVHDEDADRVRHVCELDPDRGAGARGST